MVKKLKLCKQQLKRQYPQRGYCLFLRRLFCLAGQGGGKHIFNKNAVARGRVVHKNVRGRAHQLAVLDDGAAAQVCGQ